MTVTINGTSTAVIPNASGNVGVGTASPNATGWGRAITVNGAASTNGAVELTENGTLRGYMSYSVGGGLNVYAAAGQTLSFGSNASQSVRIDTSGNVGVGTTSPNYKLDVYGSDATAIRAGVTNTSASGTAEFIAVQAGTAGTPYTQFYQGPSNAGANCVGASNAFVFTLNGADRMRISPAGYVTKPFTPAFSAVGPYSGGLNPISAAAGNSYIILWQGVSLNNGSCYSVSTGRFTAPVAGMYFFSASLCNSDNSTGPYIQIRKNGVAVSLAISYATSYNGAATSTVIQLAVNDYVDVLFGAFNATAAIDLNYSNFCGFLIG